MLYLAHHMLRENAQRDASRECLVDHERRLSYGQAIQKASGLAGKLREMGVKRGDRVAIYLPPSTYLPISIFGVLMAEAAFVPIHHGQFPDQVAHILNDCDVRVLITDVQQFSRISQITSKTRALQGLLVKGLDSNRESFDVAASTLTSFDLEATFTESCKHQIERGMEKDLAAILYTSGSTGRPKGVMLSHANIIAGARIVSDYLQITERDRLLAALPLSFDAGLNQLTTAVLQGGCTVMTPFRFGRDIVQRLLAERITGLAGVPSLWSLLSQPSSGLAKKPLPDLRYITNTGGAMPVKVLADLTGQLPQTKVFLMYGLTEAFRSTYLPPSEIARRPTSIGKAIPNTEILVLNEEGQMCGPGEIGELVHHGPTVSLGYWGHEDLTRKVLRPHPFPQPGRTQSDLVCYSGDLVKRDEKGFLFFVGRRDNQIKSAGFRISPTEVEDVICRIPSIRQAAVIGVPDSVLGQHLVAYVLAAECSTEFSSAEILSRCAAELPRHMVPRQIIVVENLPLTSSGKVNYPALRQRAVNGKEYEKL